MRILLSLLVWCVLTILMPSASHQAQAPPAKFKGVVLDAYDGRIPKASFIIEGASGSRQLETDEDGDSLGEVNVELPAGKYKFTVEKLGFKRLVVSDFWIASGARVAYEFRMEVRDCDDCDGLIAPDKPAQSPPSCHLTKP